MVRCTVKQDLNLKDCTVLSETPRGKGIGAAALRISSLMKAKPRLQNGTSTIGMTMDIPIVFKLGDSAPPPSPAPDAGPLEPSKPQQ
jgi:hypothetical protein